MRIRLTRQVGQPGTKRLSDEYGDKLICVRYRYDEKLRRRIKTVEIIVEEVPYTPPPPRIAPETLVGVQVGPKEYDVQRLVRSAGGKWNATRRVWELRYDKVVALELKARMVTEKRSISRAKKKSTNRSK